MATKPKTRRPPKRQTPAAPAPRADELGVLRVSRGAGGGLNIEAAAGGGYDIASGDRHFKSRYISFAGADTALDYSNRRKLVSISRDLDRNSLLSAMLDRWVDGVVGNQLNFRPTSGDEGWNKAAYELVRERMTRCDARGFFDAATLTRIMLRALGTDGEQLWAMTESGDIQVFETHQLGSPRDRLTAGATIAEGIELDAAGRPKGYWVSDEAYGGYVSSSSKAHWIPAENAILPAYRKRATQSHGVPLVGAGLKLYDRVDGYIDNESLAAEIDACLTFFVRKKAAAPGYPTSPPQAGRRTTTDAQGATQVLQKIEPGMIARLGADEEVDQFGAKRPGNQFTPFVEMGLTMVGACVGVPLPLALLDFKRLNYSNARTMLLQMWQTWQIWHRCCVVPAWQWVYPRWLLKEIARSETLRARADAFSAKWLPRRWPWVDPAREVEAMREEIAMGLGTITDQLELAGYTLEEYLAERAHELQRFEAMQVPTTTRTGQPAAATPPAETERRSREDQRDEQDEDEEAPPA
jgi:lambda family phage portal protein